MLNSLYQFGPLPGSTLSHHPGYAFAAGAILISYLLALTYHDIRRFQLPDRLTLSLLWAGLLLQALFTPHFLVSAVLGAAAGYLSLWAIYWLVKWVTKKEGLGYGDFKMMAALGAWLGWESLPLVAMTASVAGTAVFILRFYFYRKVGELPFGPFLAAAGGVIYVSQRVSSLAELQ